MSHTRPSFDGATIIAKTINRTSLQPNTIHCPSATQSPSEHPSPALSATSDLSFDTDTATDPSPALSAFDPYPGYQQGQDGRRGSKGGTERWMSTSYGSSHITLPSPGLSPEIKPDLSSETSRTEPVEGETTTLHLGPPAHPLSLVPPPVHLTSIVLDQTPASKANLTFIPAPTPDRIQTVKGEQHFRGGSRRADGQVECWGHRGASSEYPENTIASFVANCKQGSDGMETDLHITKDNRLICFHDAVLDRTTDGTGKIAEQDWTGNLEHVRTTQKPHQHIPLFSEVLDLLMLPENQHVTLNIDCKEENDPDKLFSMIKAEMEGYEGWQTLLAPRFVLGIWHSSFLNPAKRHLPFLPRNAITMSLSLARTHFWSRCDGFSVWFPALISKDGRKFRDECRAAGKELCVWTVDDLEEMKECMRWGVRTIITNKPEVLVKLRDEMRAKPELLLQSLLQRLVLPWSSLQYYGFRVKAEADDWTRHLEKEAGKFSDFDE